MKIPRIAESVGYIDDDLIESAANAGISVRRLPIRRLVYVAICAIIVIVTCLTVYAISGGTDWFVPREGREAPPSEDIPQIKEFVSPEGEKYFLRYDSEIDHQNAYPLYSYTDDHGNFYYYNKDGEFVKSLHNAESETLEAIRSGDDSLKITEDEARDIAEKYLLAYHGKEFFDKYEFSEIGAFDSTYEYDVVYNVLCGKDGFVKGPYASVTVRYDGVVTIHSVTNPEKFEDFNYEVIDDISRKDVEKFIENILDEGAYLKYSKDETVKGYDGYEIIDIKLNNDENGYFIGVGTHVYAKWVTSCDEIIYREHLYPLDAPEFIAVTFRYPLENK